MPGRNFLFVPGPTNVPERILRAMDRAMEDHRSAAFPDLTTGLFRDLKQVFQTTQGQPLVFPATGTGGWEAALVNTLSPGDRLLAPRYGQFSQLWIDLAQRHGLRADIVDVEWGEGAPADRIAEILTQDPQHEIKGLLIVHNETGTGVTSDIGAVRPAMDAAHSAVVRPARCARPPPGGGFGGDLRAPSPACRGCAGRGARLGLAALRARAPVVFGHRERHPRARRDEQRRRDRRRVPPLQPLAPGRPRATGG